MMSMCTIAPEKDLHRLWQYLIILLFLSMLINCCWRPSLQERQQMVYKDLGAWWEEGGKCKKKGSFPWSKSRWARDLVFFLCIFRNKFIISDQVGPKDCLTYFLFPEFWSYIVYIKIIYKNNETWKAQNFDLFHILQLICTRCRRYWVNLKTELSS